MKKIIFIFIIILTGCPKTDQTPQIHQTVQHEQQQEQSDGSPIKKYSINLMWISATLDETKNFIGFDSEATTHHRIIEPVIKWAKANPKAEVFFWYDKNYTSDKAFQNTKHLFEKYAQHENLTHVKMRNIREIPIVAKNPDAFSHQLPIYFRVDLFKPIILVNSIEHEGNDAAIFSDMEVGDLRPLKDRMNKAELFSPIIMEELKRSGLLLNKGNPVENQFLQLVNDSLMISSIKEAIVNTNLLRMKTTLNLKSGFDSRFGTRQDFLHNLYDVVYHPSTTQDVFRLYKAKKTGIPLRARLNIMKDRDADWENYNPSKDGYWPFGNLKSSSVLKVLLDKDTMIDREDVLQFPADKLGRRAREVDVRQSQQKAWSTRTIPTQPANGEYYEVVYWD